MSFGLFQIQKIPILSFIVESKDKINIIMREIYLIAFYWFAVKYGFLILFSFAQTEFFFELNFLGGPFSLLTIFFSLIVEH